MPKHTWTIAALLTGLLILGFVGSVAWNKQRDLEATQAALAAVREEKSNLLSRAAAAEVTIEEAFQEVTNLHQTIAISASTIRALQEEKDRVAAAQKELESKMRSALESKEITISELQGKLTVNILERVLFDSGEALLKPEGEEVLRQIAGILSQYPNRQIHVIGHTDNVPIRVSARSRFASNWELSTARATAAVRFLQEQAGVDPKRLGALGYGEFQPVADNATAEGRAKNRRIAVVVLPEHFVGTESATNAAPATLPSAGSTNDEGPVPNGED